MKAKRNFKGFKKGQPIPADKFTEDQVKIMVAYGFIQVEKEYVTVDTVEVKAEKVSKKKDSK
ncbi:MAG: hypothetical protein DRH97_00190 [Chloroflexi bacterium]|nr:MAG: hypothetical protein DRH97_00190 [Chloroflexota bacterium]